MNSEINRILNMVREGKINSDEGTKLVESLMPLPSGRDPVVVNNSNVSALSLKEDESKFVDKMQKSQWGSYVLGGALIITGLIGLGVVIPANRVELVAQFVVTLCFGASNIYYAKTIEKYNNILARLNSETGKTDKK